MIRPIGITVREIELCLRPPEITRAGRILRPVLLPEKVTRHMLHRIEPEPIAMGLVNRPPDRADQHLIHVLRDRIAHVIPPIAPAPRRVLMQRIRRVHARVRERFARLTHVVLAIAVEILEIEFSIARANNQTGYRVGVTHVLIRLLVREWMKDFAVRVRHARQVIVGIKSGLARMADAPPFRITQPLGLPRRIETHIRTFLRDVPRKGIPVQHLPLIAVVDAVARLFPAFRRIDGLAHEMKILRHKARHVWKKNARSHIVQRPRVVRRHVVEIHPQPEPMGYFHQPQKVRLRPIARRHRAGLILVSKIETIQRIVAHRIRPRCALGRLRQPERCIARLRHLRDAPLDLLPRRIEILEHRLAMHDRGRRERGA